MHLIEHYELKTPRVVAFRLKAQSEIRVLRGRLWLTLAGLPEDVWLQPGQAWTLPVNAQLWLSAEPVAAFQIAQFSAARPAAPRRLKREPDPFWLKDARDTALQT
jgi:hypothetical protein